ncbi:MAG TPA: hydrogenase maturation nickel metallochaperone HypA [Sulfuricurvum sp.]|nr:MAG: hydrogenase maturation nickel metallochaperone HypA [Campylobacterales bacterium 16-40-21]OZA03858.1 MAG: hydrogenase maturation nickel metallochaperone HypA [Sulfuricurvum sp. 17-40-25]HQS65622.1 hydrogenase maturation nickel metallochaperone HypA [Sulfuricurvum sp.]HQT36128.1 hydrogenase maturation nickel metallochaperone HypA [Sulfuricurvum sp.]
MHEYSIVQALIDQCEELAVTNKASSITKVVVKIGKYSGVEPHLLQIAFETFKDQTVCKHAEFVMSIQPLVIICSDCQQESVLDQPHYICPACESHSIRVTDGEDMMLMSLEMEA